MFDVRFVFEERERQRVDVKVSRNRRFYGFEERMTMFMLKRQRPLVAAVIMTGAKEKVR